MRKFLLATGIVSTISCIFYLFVRYSIQKGLHTASPQSSPIALFAIIVPLIYILSYFYSEKISSIQLKRIIGIILIIISIPVYLFSGLCGVIAVLNGINEPVKAGVVFSEFGYKRSSDSYDNLKARLGAFDKKLSSLKLDKSVNEKAKKYDFSDSNVLTVLAQTKNERDELLDFLWKSEGLSFSKVSSSSYIENLTLVPQLTFIDFELTDIKRMFENGEYDRGINRYVALWEAVGNQFNSKNLSYIQTIAIHTEVAKLLNFYSENLDKINSKDMRSLSPILTSIENKIDDLYISGWSSEYLYKMNILKDLAKEFGWPIYSYNRTLNDEYARYKFIVDSSREPYYDINKVYAKLDSDKQLSRIINQKITAIDYFKNPIGQSAIAVTPRSVIESSIKSKEKTKSRVRAFNYIINKDKGIEIPTDNLTGKKYIVKDEKDYLEVSTGYTESNKPAFTFKIKK